MRQPTARSFVMNTSNGEDIFSETKMDKLIRRLLKETKERAKARKE